MKKFIATMAMVVLGATAGFAAQADKGDTGKQTSVSQDSLVASARSARTAADHADVARQYRERAESLSKDAAKLDQQLQKLATRPQPQMAGKWPAMYGNRDSQHASNLRREALAAKQAAHEATVAAERHYQLAIEQGFAPRNAN
jgi:hypothetical protein